MVARSCPLSGSPDATRCADATGFGVGPRNRAIHLWEWRRRGARICQVDGNVTSPGALERIHDLNATRVDRRLLALVLLALVAVAACGPQVVTPTPPVGRALDGGALGAVPRPGQASELGTFGPGVDGTGDFLSFASELSPASTMASYADRLTSAGYRDVGRQGAWRVFSDRSLTLWVRVGSGGPPTSLIVRVGPTPGDAATLVSLPDRPAGPSVLGVGESLTGPADRLLSAGPPDPRSASRPSIAARRPDPPHGGPRSGGAGVAGTGTSGGGTAVATGGGTLGASVTPGASPSPAGGAAGPAIGTGSGLGGGGGSRP